MKENYQILVIDDSSTALLLMQYALNEEGYQTQIASNVREALTYLEKYTPDMVLLDLSMPEISGYDFLGMRAKLNLLNTPIIVVSAYDSEESVSEAMTMGAADFIPKPIHIETLLDKIKAHLKT
jgi:DNA-binding response OmpR family regulator